MRRYDTLIVAGCGNIGRAFCLLGKEFLAEHSRIILMDRESIAPGFLNGAVSIVGDIENPAFMDETLAPVEGDFLFVNLCAGTDNYAVRLAVAQHGGAYIDTACSCISALEEYRYTRLMPHTFRPTENREPHIVCCGVNPGMVELIARLIAHDCFPGETSFDIFLYEYDGLQAPLDGSRVGVSWSPRTLIDEALLSPTLKVRDGRLLEAGYAPTHITEVRWGGRWRPARIMGHEELWNFRLMAGIRVENAAYYYALHPDVMDVLAGGAADDAKHSLVVPGRGDAIHGKDTLVVRIVCNRTQKVRTVAWQTDHLFCRKRHDINGVEFQVAASLLVFLDLLRYLPGCFPGEVLCASTLPYESVGWPRVRRILEQHNVHWRPADNLDLSVSDDVIMTSNTGIPCRISASSIHGLGVFAMNALAGGIEVTQVQGDIYTRQQFLSDYDADNDRFLQIGRDRYIGPRREMKDSRSLDEFFNHSCEPNCGIAERNGCVMLTTLRGIRAGEELTWDYSTGIDDDDAPPSCSCRAPGCRGLIQPFRHLPEATRRKYLQRGAVLAYVAENVDETPGMM